MYANRQYTEVSIALLNCVDPDDVDQICCDHNIDCTIEGKVITGTDNLAFVEGVIAALMHVA